MNYDIINILEEFVSKNPLRESLCEIQNERGFLFATDAHIAIRTKAESGLTPTYQIKEQWVDKIFGVFDQLDKKAPSLTFDSQELINFLSEYKTSKEYKYHIIECDECGGSGEVQWVYEGTHSDHTKEMDCPECNGRGEMKVGESEFIGYDYPRDFMLRIFDKNVSPFYIEKVANVIPNVKFYDGEDYTIYATGGDFEFLIKTKYMSDFYSIKDMNSGLNSDKSWVNEAAEMSKSK